tara:strand:+ start:232 stop:828 length:597 start_codon:yes stop_codon:yes gene_type:complete
MAKKFPKVEKYLRSYGKFIIRQARKIIKKKGKKDSGKLLSSLKYVIKEKKGVFDIEFLSAKHGEFIDKGVQGLGRKNLPSGSTAKNVKPNRTYIDAATGKRKKSPYKFKTSNIRPSIMQKYVRRKGLNFKNEDGTPMSIQSMAFIVGRAIKAKGIQGISFYSQPISAFSKKFRKDLMAEFETDVLNQIITRKRKSGNR